MYKFVRTFKKDSSKNTENETHENVQKTKKSNIVEENNNQSDANYKDENTLNIDSEDLNNEQLNSNKPNANFSVLQMSKKTAKNESIEVNINNTKVEIEALHEHKESNLEGKKKSPPIFLVNFSKLSISNTKVYENLNQLKLKRKMDKSDSVEATRSQSLYNKVNTYFLSVSIYLILLEND